MLQFIHAEMLSVGQTISGRLWLKGPGEQWHSRLSFFNPRTIKRAFLSLESAGVLATGNYNDTLMDRTKWYSVNYERLGGLLITKPVNSL